MAKKKMSPSQNGESTGGYFRRLLKQNPQWLKGRSNEEILTHWLADNPGHKEVPDNVKGNLSNIKSVLRSKKRKKVAKRAEEDQPTGATLQPAAPVARKALGSTKLDELELQIDECLILARQLDRIRRRGRLDPAPA